jgi:hypothetical protein
LARQRFRPKVHESTDTPHPLEKHLFRRQASTAARARDPSEGESDDKEGNADRHAPTLHRHAMNTYYGQWPEDSAASYAGRIAGHCP